LKTIQVSFTLLLITICCGFSYADATQEAPKKPEGTVIVPPAQGPVTSAPNSDQSKSLDDLLGISEKDSKKTSAENDRTQKEALNRILSEKEAKNTLEASIDGMRRSAVLLGEKESGTAVQRIQEDVLARLDALIQSAQSQQQQQQSSSSSSSSSQSKGSSQPKGSQGQKKSESASAEEQRRAEAKQRAEKQGEKASPGKSKPSGDQPGELPPAVDAVKGGVIEETDAEWGNLPPRTREILRQGVREKMSSVYRRWTEAYYRRIAEEAKP